MLGLQLSTSIWNADTQGTLQSLATETGADTTGGEDGTTGDDTETSAPTDDPAFTLSELNFARKPSLEFGISLDLNMPYIPRISGSYHKVSHTSSPFLARDITFAGNTFLAGSNVEQEIILESSKLELGYTLLDSWVVVDVGVQANNLKFSTEIVGSAADTGDDSGTDTGTDTGDGATDATAPTTFTREDTETYIQGSAALTFHLPEVPITFRARIDQPLSSGETSVDQIIYAIGYTHEGLSTRWRAELGYRDFSWVGTLDNQAVDIMTSGAYFDISFTL